MTKNTYAVLVAYHHVLHLMARPPEKEWKFSKEDTPRARKMKTAVCFSFLTCSWPKLSKFWMEGRRKGWTVVCWGVTWDHWIMASIPIMRKESIFGFYFFLRCPLAQWLTHLQPSKVILEWMNRWTKKQIKAVRKNLVGCVLSISLKSFFSFSLSMYHPGLESQDYCSILQTSLTSVFSLSHWTFMSGKLLSMEFKICANLVQYIGLLSNILYFKHDLTSFNAFCCGN